MSWTQFVAMVRLRFQLTKNQLSRVNTLNSVLYSIIAMFVAFTAAWSFLGSAIGGVYLFRNLTPSQAIFLWNIVTAVLVFACFFEFVNRVQQNDAIEIGRLLHLPISFHGAFFLNYASSLVSLNMLMLAPIVFGFAIAMPIANGWRTAVSIPLAISFLFVLTSLMYLMRGWFAARMKNKRTKGWLAIIVPFSAIGIFMLLIPMMEDQSLYKQLESSPIGWLSSGINHANVDGNIVPGLLASLAMFVAGGACLWYAFKTSMKKYTGADVSARTSELSKPSEDWSTSGQFKQLPGTDQVSGSIALTSMRSLLRSPEVLAAFLPVVVTFLLGGPYLLGWEGYEISDSVLPWLPLGMIFITLIGFPAFLFSTFSFDRDGFRAYMLSPAPRKKILHGKNLGIGILTVVCGWISMILLQCFIPTGVGWFLGMLVQIPATYLLLTIIGNLISVFCPIGFKRGSMQPVNVAVIPALAIYLGVFAGPVLSMVPTVIAFSIANMSLIAGSASGWIFFVLSILQLLAAWGIYQWCLGPLGEWLWNQETKIVEVVANIPE